MIRLSPFALAGALIATSVSVLAAAPIQATTRNVTYGDLDLTSATGRALLDERIRAAANAVCTTDNNGLALIAACRRDSIHRALADVDRALRAMQVRTASR